MREENIDIDKLNRYCVVCGKERGPYLKRCCTPNSLVAIKKRGLFTKKITYYDLNGLELNQKLLFQIWDRERALQHKEIEEVLQSFLGDTTISEEIKEILLQLQASDKSQDISAIIAHLIEYLFSETRFISDRFEPDKTNVIIRELLLALVPYSTLTLNIIELTIETASYRDNYEASKQIGFRYTIPDFKPGTYATESLCSFENQVSNNILYMISNIKDSTYHIEGNDDWEGAIISLDFRERRQIALRELIRRKFYKRGDYDLTAYSHETRLNSFF